MCTSEYIHVCICVTHEIALGRHEGMGFGWTADCHRSPAAVATASLASQLSLLPGTSLSLSLPPSAAAAAPAAVSSVV